MKTLSYENNTDDFFALQKHFKNHSPLAKKSKTVFRIIYITFLCLMTVLAVLTPDAQRMTILSTFLLSMLFFAIVVLAMQSSMRKEAKNSPSKFLGKWFLGQHHLHLLGDQLQEEHSMGSTSLFYEGLNRVDETADHLFIFNSERSAFIVPKRNIDSEQFMQFKTQLQAQLPPKVPYAEFK